MRRLTKAGIIRAVSVILRATRPDELDSVLAMEAAASAAPFIVRWSVSEHQAALADPDQDHIAIEEDGRLVGFILLAGLRNPNHAVELRRIVMSEPGRGLGSRALALAIEYAFGRLDAHRLWLDVKVRNDRARRVYERAGFTREGVLRDAILTDGTYESLIVMSILKSEHLARHGQ